MHEHEHPVAIPVPVGADRCGVSVILAALLIASPAPLTAPLEEITGGDLTLDVAARGQRLMTARERAWLEAGPARTCSYRTGTLRTAGGQPVAQTSLAWLPERIPLEARAALDAADAPAGKILGPLGMTRTARRALVMDGVQGSAGEVAVRSQALVLMCGRPAAITTESVLADFARTLRPGTARAPA